MALSSSESALLTQTCENMNIAANTCREVLEMLRNLGNTGVVDIATHNNTPGAHASDNTLVHYVNNYTLSVGEKNGLPYAPLTMNINAESLSKAHRSYTHGKTGTVSTGSVISVERYLSDASNNKLLFEEQTSITDAFVNHYFATRLYDANNKFVYSGWHFNIGRPSSIYSNATPLEPYGAIRPTLTGGEYSFFGQPFEINILGITPTNNNAVSLGYAGYAWKDLFVVNSPTVTSDRRAKKDVSALGSHAVDFIKALRPVSYRLRKGEGHLDFFNEQGEAVPNDTPDREGVRTHWGLIAQEVKEALSAAGYEDAALWCLANKDDPDSQQSLRYEELIAPMIKVIQQQQERIEALERKVA